MLNAPCPESAHFLRNQNLSLPQYSAIVGSFETDDINLSWTIMLSEPLLILSLSLSSFHWWYPTVFLNSLC